MQSVSKVCLDTERKALALYILCDEAKACFSILSER